MTIERENDKEIEISERWTIQRDDFTWILREYAVSKSTARWSGGKIGCKKTFPSDLDGVARNILSKDVKNHDIENLEALVKYYEQAVNNLVQFLKEKGKIK